MTTIMAKAYPERIEILSDGGITNSVSGAYQLLEKVNKVRASQIARLAITGCGPNSYNQRVSQTCINWCNDLGGSVDATLRRSRVEISNQRRKGGETLQPSRMLLAGISESQGPGLWEFITGPHDDSLLEPWRLKYLGQSHRLFGSHPTEEEVEAIKGSENLADLVPIMEAFRKRDRRRCNSHVDLTVIHRQGIETFRLHEWPEDKIGEPMWTEADWLASQLR